MEEPQLEDTVRIYSQGLDLLEFILYAKGGRVNKTEIRQVIRAIRRRAFVSMWPDIADKLGIKAGEE